MGSYPVNLHPDAAEYLGAVCDGDARRALSTLEIGVLSSLDEIPHDENGNRIGCVEFTKELAAESLQRRLINYDRDGDNHYDTISALIKSIRGSDPDAAIYWLARMLEGGEDVRFWRVVLSSWQAKMSGTPTRTRYPWPLPRHRRASWSVCPNASSTWRKR